ncbi:MAG: DoxX family protein [Actinomycetes bacterium]
MTRTTARLWAATLVRVALGGVWVAAGAAKIPDPAASVRAVRAYQVLPEASVTAVGYGLPFLEITVGVLLIAGLGTRVVAIASSVLLVTFIAGVSSAWARGLTIDCGCFGGGGQVSAAQTAYPQELARDAVLLVASLALAWMPASRLALDTHTLATRVGEPP